MHRHLFLENYLKIVNMFTHIVMIDEILFNLHVVNGIYIKLQNDDIV